MKWLFLGVLGLIILPFLVKLCYMSFILYRYYFFGALNSEYPIPHQFLSKLKKEKTGEQQVKKIIGFDVSFTEEDKQKLEARRKQKRVVMQ